MRLGGMHRSSPQGEAELDAPRLTAQFRFEINTRKPVVRWRVSRLGPVANDIVGKAQRGSATAILPLPASGCRAAFIPKAIAWRA